MRPEDKTLTTYGAWMFVSGGLTGFFIGVLVEQALT